jgi:hypothetical protein
MRARRVASAVAVVGSLGAVLLVKRRSAASRERIDLYLADGSKVTLQPGSPEFARLAPLAEDALRAVGA